MNPRLLTVIDIPQHRILNNRLMLHNRTKELGWISSARFHALQERGEGEVPVGEPLSLPAIRRRCTEGKPSELCRLDACLKLAFR
jgi:hypothetical protein